MNRSRYQLVNRGRKGKPCWTVEDYANSESQYVGKHVASDRNRARMFSLMKCLRRAERANQPA